MSKDIKNIIDASIQGLDWYESVQTIEDLEKPTLYYEKGSHRGIVEFPKKNSIRVVLDCDGKKIVFVKTSDTRWDEFSLDSE